MLACVLLALLLLLLGFRSAQSQRRPTRSTPVREEARQEPSRQEAPRSEHRTPEHWPPAVVLAPMAGRVPELDALLSALCRQDYPNFEVVVIIEAERERTGDPTEAAVRVAARERAGLPDYVRVVRAERTSASSQKCANLIVGLAAASPGAQVVALIDADAVPHAHWLRDLVRPLIASSDERPPSNERPPIVTTGFRWYVPGQTTPGLFRSAFSATALSVLVDPERAFAWGGSLALSRRDLDRLGIPAAWARALSDDLTVTRAVRKAGGHVHFVPECVLPSFGDPSWPTFREFAARQLTVLRHGSPGLWVGILAFHAALALTQVAAIATALGWGDVPGGSPGRVLACLILAAPSAVAAARTAERFRALRQRPLARVAGWDRFWHLHVALSLVLTWIVLAAAIVAGFRREMTWCGIRYRFRSRGRVEVATTERRDAA